jgi:hypothetical protein
MVGYLPDLIIGGLFLSAPQFFDAKWDFRRYAIHSDVLVTENNFLSDGIFHRNVFNSAKATIPRTDVTNIS